MLLSNTHSGASIDPDLLLAVFLPALLFESSFAMEVHQIKVCLICFLCYAFFPNPLGFHACALLMYCNRHFCFWHSFGSVNS